MGHIAQDEENPASVRFLLQTRQSVHFPCGALRHHTREGEEYETVHLGGSHHGPCGTSISWRRVHEPLLEGIHTGKFFSLAKRKFYPLDARLVEGLFYGPESHVLVLVVVIFE